MAHPPAPPAPLFGSACMLHHPDPPAVLNGQPDWQLDHHYSALFLSEFNASPETFNAYRREVERFLQWLWHIDNATLITLDRATMYRYLDFCLSPPASWIGRAVVPRFKHKQGGLLPHPDWRPFIGKANGITLSNNSRKALLSILSSYFNYLIESDYLLFNPVALMRQKNRHIVRNSEPPTIRRLTDEQWQLILSLVDQDILNGNKKAHRALFILASLYLMGVRISEIASSDSHVKMMTDFRRDHAQQWWFHVIGKGNKSRRVPVNRDMLTILIDYRTSRELTRLPTPNDTAPLLENFNTRTPSGLSSRMIRYIVKAYFARAVEHLKQVKRIDEADHLSAATVHWLRHTSISEQVTIRDTYHVQKDAGHRDSKTTDQYIDVFDNERHHSMEAFHLRRTRT